MSPLTALRTAIDQNAAQKMSESIVGSFPVGAKAFATSLGGRLLDRFSLYLEFLSYPLPSDKPPKILEKRHNVERAQKVLRLLAEHSFDARGPGTSKPGTKGAKQKSRKQSKGSKLKAVMDTKSFDDLGMTVPADQGEALAVAASVIEEQKHIMEVRHRGSSRSRISHPSMRSALSTSPSLRSPARDHTAYICLYL